MAELVSALLSFSVISTSAVSFLTIKDDDSRMIHLKKHFEYLHKVAEDRAVKVIKTVVAGKGGRANRMDTEGNVYLPIHMGYRNCYYRYMELLGYTVTVCPNGTLTVVEEDPTTNTNDEEQRRAYVNLRTYWRQWKRLYPHMKVSRPAEDVRVLLYIC